MTAARLDQPRMLTPTAYAHEIPTEHGTDEWLTVRRGGIGGTCAQAIMGAAPYKDAFTLYLEKRADPYILTTEAAQPFSEPRHFGNLLEPIVVAETARRITEKTGQPIRLGKLPMLRDANCPYRLANVDAFGYDDDGPADAMPTSLFEAKTAGLHSLPAWRDGPPSTVIWQAAHYLLVTGLPVAYVSCLVAGQRLFWYRLDADPGLLDTLATAEAEFWQRVVEGRPPLPTGAASTTRVVHDLHPAAVAGATVDLSTPDDAGMLAEYKAATVAAGVAKERLSAITNRIKLRIGDAETATMDGRTVATYRSFPVTRLDGGALKRYDAQLWERFAVTTHERRLKVS